MLLTFAATNYKSFAGTAELSLAAKPSERAIASAALPIDLPGSQIEAVLSAAAIYGANASGKTNFLLALKAMRNAIMESQSDWKPHQRIPIDPHVSKSEMPTELEIQLVAEGIRYRYGFKADRKMFREEWLYSYPHGRERELFKRTTVEDGESVTIDVATGNGLSGSKREFDSTSRRLRQNSLFLSAAAQDNQLECLAIYNWFSTRFRFIETSEVAHGRNVATMMAHDFAEFKKLLVPFVRFADGSIRDIKTRKNAQGDSKIEDNLDDFDGFAKFIKAYDANFVLTDGENEYDIEFEKESRGVKRLYELSFHIITALQYGKVVIVDELESSMHAHIASQLLSLFQNTSSNPNRAQLIFTTHETRLLNLEHLRRDQIWFCEREGINSELYPLIDFSPRKDESFEASYLRGRYGGVPRASIDPEWIAAINVRNEAAGD